MFTYQQGKDQSLQDLCGDLYHQGVSLKKQSLHQRFNAKAVRFMKAVLSSVLECEFESCSKKTKDLSTFNRVRIKDSTRFALPKAYADTYKGHGGATANSESMISIQYEYDLLSSQTLDLRLTTGTRNDQLDAKENTHNLAPNDLLIRDLGYATLTYLSKIIKAKAYFLNRLTPQTNVYLQDNPKMKLDFTKCHEKIKKYNVPYLEYQVLIGKKAQLPCRLLIYPVDETTYEKRVRKTSKQAKSKGHKVSKDYKTKAKLTLYITNAREDKLPVSMIKKVYSLRWQIELFFKIWKSQGKINQVKEMKIHRFECMLLAKLIWLIIHWKIFKYILSEVSRTKTEESCSIWKYYKHAYRINTVIREVITKPNELIILLNKLVKGAIQMFNLEKKKNKTTYYQIIRELN